MRWFTDISVWSEKPNVIQVFNSNNECVDYIPERTCKRVSSAIEVGEVNGHRVAIPQYRCGECNRWLSDADKYCPHCGARVIGADE